MMKKINSNNLKKVFLSMLALVLIWGCERDISSDAPEAGFSTLGEIFIDAPIGMGEDFYLPFGDSNFEALNFEGTTTFEGNASIEINVPNADDPNGNYAGAIFRIDGAGRDLRGYDALTFYARASQGVTLGEIGFGEDFIQNKYQSTLTNVSLSTAWKKIIVPIPDPSKLNEERGMLRYAAGTQNTNGLGYTIWIDELKFEKLGTLAQAQPKMLGGADVDIPAFINVPITLDGFTQTFNAANGQNITVDTTPAYFEFESSNPSVASVDENGIVTVLSIGTATITGKINGVQAEGSLTLNVGGSFDFAPVPPNRNPEDVVSVFSDAYNNVAVDYYNGFFTPDGQTTQGGAPPLNILGDNIINYTQLNFVGIGTFLDVPSLNVSAMTHLHIDIKVNEAIEPGDFLNVQLINSVGNGETSGTVSFGGETFTQDDWVSLDIPITDFGLGDTSQIGLLFFISNSTISDIFVDNIYYYRE